MIGREPGPREKKRSDEREQQRSHLCARETSPNARVDCAFRRVRHGEAWPNVTHPTRAQNAACTPMLGADTGPTRDSLQSKAEQPRCVTSVLSIAFKARCPPTTFAHSGQPLGAKPRGVLPGTRRPVDGALPGSDGARLPHRRLAQWTPAFAAHNSAALFTSAPRSVPVAPRSLQGYSAREFHLCRSTFRVRRVCGRQHF